MIKIRRLDFGEKLFCETTACSIPLTFGRSYTPTCETVKPTFSEAAHYKAISFF